MAKITKLLASAIAMASTFTTVASMSTAFAYTDEEALINSYADPVAREMIECCLNDGISLQDAKELVDGYSESRLSSSNARSSRPVRTATGTRYYNPYNIADTQHYLLAIVKDSSSVLDDVFQFSFNTTYVAYDFCYSHCGRYGGMSSNLSLHVNEVSSSYIVTGVYSTNTTSASEVEPMVKYWINTNNSTNERKIIDSISFVPDIHDNIDYDIFARGDVDHNGIINEDDAYDLMDYLIRRRSDFDYSYTDDSYNRRTDYAPVTNRLAADFNQDGSLNMSDAVGINNYITSPSNV